MKEITFTFNKECNWDCEYCNQKLMNKSIRKSDDELIIDFNKWLKNCTKYENEIYLYLCGGEPGLWSNKLWEGITKTIEDNSKTIFFTGVFTNGAIFNNDFILNNNFRRLMYLWHCTPTIKDVIVDTSFINDRKFMLDINVIPMIVLQKKEIKYLEEFINNNPKLGNFYLNLAENSKYTEGVEDFTMEDYEEVIKILRKYPHRISLESLMGINATKYRLKTEGLESLQKICSLQSSKVSIDLSEDVIYRCCDFRSKVELNEENLKLKFNNKLFTEESCGTCVNSTAYFGEERKNS